MCDYSITFYSILKVFDVQNIYVNFYEHMRERSKSSAICNAEIDF